MDGVHLSTAQMMDVLKVVGVAGADVGAGHEPQALVRLRLAQAILGGAGPRPVRRAGGDRGRCAA